MPKQTHGSEFGPPAGRRTAGRGQNDPISDPYQRRGKPVEPAVCPDCNAAFHKGRWAWKPAPADAHQALCPACARIRDQYPAGLVRLRGSFLQGRHAEIMHLVQHQQQAEAAEHPLNRIMEIHDRKSEIDISTTDIHLPRRIVEALHSAYQGEVTLQYDQDAYFLRADWARDA